MVRTGPREERDGDWTARHARTKRPETQRVVEEVRPDGDDWDVRHAATKQGG